MGSASPEKTEWTYAELEEELPEDIFRRVMEEIDPAAEGTMVDKSLIPTMPPMAPQADIVPFDKTTGVEVEPGIDSELLKHTVYEEEDFDE